MDNRMTKENVIRDLRRNMHHVGVCKGLLIHDFNMTEEEVDDLIREYSKEAQTIASDDVKASLELLFGDLKEEFGE